MTLQYDSFEGKFFLFLAFPLLFVCVCFVAYGRLMKYFAFWVNRFSFLSFIFLFHLHRNFSSPSLFSIMFCQSFEAFSSPPPFFLYQRCRMISHSVGLTIEMIPALLSDGSFHFFLGCSLRLLWRSSSFVAVHLVAIGALPLHTPSPRCVLCLMHTLFCPLAFEW